MIFEWLGQDYTSPSAGGIGCKIGIGQLAAAAVVSHCEAPSVSR